MNHGTTDDRNAYDGSADASRSRLLKGFPDSVAADNIAAPPILTGLRWLAHRVLGPAVIESLPHVPAPCLVSEHVKRCNRTLCDYVLHCIAHPQAGSKFEARTRSLRGPRDGLLSTLCARGYDGLVYAQPDSIVGHVFFQRHSSALHGFSAAVNEGLNGKGCSGVMLLDYVAYACGLPGISTVRVGTGSNNVTRRLLARVKRHAQQLGWCVGSDGWVTFAPPHISSEPQA